MPLTLDTSIQYLKGVGEKRAKLFAKLGISSVYDLMRHFPRDYIDLRDPCSIADADGPDNIAVRARLMRKSPEQRIRAGLSIFKLIAEDHTGSLEVTVFNSRYTVQNLEVDREYIFLGKIEGGLTGWRMSSPLIMPVPDKHSIFPVYPQTARLSSKVISNCTAAALRELGEDIQDAIPEAVRVEYSIPGLWESLWSIHFPESPEAAKAARERFIFEELLVMCCGLSILGSGNKAELAQAMAPADMDAFYESLPFKPTNAQLRAICDATADMQSKIPMNRLVQGDVGSGKTLVAAACIYFSYKSGLQSAMMAPTEILAEQHYATLSKLLGSLGIRCAVLTGSSKASEKKAVLLGLADGTIDLCVGTHALLSEGVEFARLALVVTDEQHRFGVAQRAKLSQKGRNAHVLVMSATPIPRTLSLIMYGDLSLSVIDELPPGRQPIDTFVISSSKRARAMGFIKNAIDSGRQAYIICPLIEMGEFDTGLVPAKEYCDHLAETSLKGYKLALLHGKMKSSEKEDIMRRFSHGEIQALVSTTVVEVGVDVPNAAIILIENAERFGLSQLHQLRGRVGRGSEKSYCILVSDAKSGGSTGRLNIMKTTSDGFELAEYDLKTRGPGDFFGYRQHGMPGLRIASLSENIETMNKAKSCADRILEYDPELKSPEHKLLGEMTGRMLSAIGDRPN